MQVFYRFNELPKDYRHAVVTLGVFDGLHLAHTAILRRVIESARQKNCRAMMITFDPHPRNVLAFPKSPVLQLTTPAEKIKLLQDSELDAVLFLKVTRTLLDTGSEHFVKSVLVDKLSVREVIVGYDYHFGKDRDGEADQLIEYGKKYHFTVVTVPAIRQAGKAVRSSAIRTLLATGQVEKVTRLLGRFYSVQGKVIRGAGRGRRLGFPTANIDIGNSGKMIPGDGIYLTTVTVQQRNYFGLCYIGVRKTFHESERVIEVYLFNSDDRDRYRLTITVNFLERIRAELKFDRVEDLIARMKLDEKIGLEKIKQYNVENGGLTEWH